MALWALIAYLLHKVGAPFRAIAFVLGIGLILGNLAAYAGVKVAAKVLGRPPGNLRQIAMLQQLRLRNYGEEHFHK
jgi:hypothetical protein